MKRRFRITAGLLLAAVLWAATAPAAWADQGGSDASQAAVQEEEQQAEETEPVIQVEARIDSCQVTQDKQHVRIQGSSKGDTAGTDGNLYIFELRPYETDVENKAYVWQVQSGVPFDFQVPLGWDRSPERIYNRFAAAVYDGEKYVIVSPLHYVENPEVVAKNQDPFDQPLTKKGLRIQVDMVQDAMELGVKHAGTDILFQQILGSGIDFNYGGKTYHFNKGAIEEYDRAISTFSSKGISVTAVILNGWNENTLDLIYPGTARSDQAYHYMFNVASEAGYEQTRAIAAFLAQRYDGSNPSWGKVSNWVIGNEVNNQKDWNYMGPTDLETYVRAYQEAFRVFYTAIKTTNASDRVYISLDYNWNRDSDGKLKYNGRDIVDTFNAMGKEGGQFDWGLAYHPYPYPMVEPEFWDDDQTGLVNDTFESPIVNFKNLNTLTDYFAQDFMRMRDGNVRPIILTEQGFTAKSQSRGDVPDIQAAAFAYSYYLVDSNPYINAYLLSRQVDGPAEVLLGTAQGLWECDMSQPDRIVATMRRRIWAVFKNIDRKNTTLENTEFAKEIIGIDKWSDVIPNFRWRKQEMERQQ